MAEHLGLFDAVQNQMSYPAVLVASSASWHFPPSTLGGQGCNMNAAEYQAEIEKKEVIPSSTRATQVEMTLWNQPVFLKSFHMGKHHSGNGWSKLKMP